MEKSVCVFVLRDNNLTSDLPAYIRSQNGIYLLFV